MIEIPDDVREELASAFHGQESGRFEFEADTIEGLIQRMRECSTTLRRIAGKLDRCVKMLERQA